MREKTVHSGIYYGWVVTATTCVMAFLAMGGGSGFGVFVLPMSEEFGWQRGTISLAAALGALISGLSQPFVGHLYDRWGGRNRSMAQSGSLLSTTAALSKCFHRQCATVLALNAAGASFGGLLLIPMTDAIIQFAGWRLAWVVLGLLVLVLAVPLAFCFLRDDPAEMGLRPDGDGQPSATAQAGPARPGLLEATSWREAFGSLPMWQLCGGYPAVS
jgi:MFS family permease